MTDADPTPAVRRADSNDGDDDGDVDVAGVVVVGAGVSGVSVATQLIAAGVDVRVHERRDRVGGRLHSIASAHGEGRLDLGASWFWPGEHRVQRLVDELGIRTHAHHLAGDALYHAPGPGGIGTAQRLDGNPIDVTSGRFTDGADRLVEAMARRLPAGAVRLLDPVLRIEQFTATGTDDTRLRVTTEHGVVDAADVVIALPPALAAATIELPDLPTEMRTLAEATPVWMGAIAKVVVEFSEPFWSTHGLSGSAISHLGPMREIHDLSGPGHRPAALFGFAPLTSSDDAPTEAQIRRQLRELFGETMPDPVRITITSWLDEAATSPPGAARLGDYGTYGHAGYQRPILDGRLHWSSTETATRSPGHIEGA
ncbi:MAG: FAD-dependent oxidoreductase, partial [Actinomycetota bacterium]